MAFETREIVFSTKEFNAALLLYAVQTGHCRHAAKELSRIELNGDRDLSANLITEAADAEIKLTTGDILSALISFCIQCRIPLPQAATKSLRRVGDQVALVINHWRFSTPAAPVA